MLRKPILLVASLWGSSASADLIVDTGTPDSPGSSVFAETQYFAGEFTVVGGGTVESVEAYLIIESNGGQPGNVTANLHTDGGEIPGAVLFSDTFFLTTSLAFDWHGAFELDWEIDPRTYWVSFIPDSNIDGYQGQNAPDGLENYAKGISGSWLNASVHHDAFDDLDVAFRIGGTATAATTVPGLLAFVAIPAHAHRNRGCQKLRTLLQRLVHTGSRAGGARAGQPIAARFAFDRLPAARVRV